MTEKLDGDESVADDHPVRFGGNVVRKSARRATNVVASSASAWPTAARRGPGQADILGASDLGSAS